MIRNSLPPMNSPEQNSVNLPDSLRNLLARPAQRQTPQWARTVIQCVFDLLNLSIDHDFDGEDPCAISTPGIRLSDSQARALCRLRRLHREVGWESNSEPLRDELRAILLAQLQTLLSESAFLSSFQENACHEN